MHPIQDLFLESFSYELQFDMHFYMHSYLHKIFILVKSGCYTYRDIHHIVRGFLGILLHLELWKHFFHMRVKVSPLRLIRGVIQQPCPRRVGRYLWLPVVTLGEG
jgi:hypothetical protein